MSKALEKYDVVILGLGAMGSATLYTLAKRGVKVCGVEQYGPAHDRGSSHGETRLIRKAYFEHPDYIPLLNRAYDLWDELDRESPQNLITWNDLIIAGKPDSAIIRGLDLCYENHDLPYEKLAAREAKLRFSQFDFPQDFLVYYDPIAGFLHVEICIQEYIRLALTAGATPYTNERVLSWVAKSDCVSVKTEHREIAADKLIITAGAWTARELRSLHLDLNIWRKLLFWYDSPNIENYRAGQFPCFYFQVNFGGFYGFPAINKMGLKIGEHEIPDITDSPDTLDRRLNDDDEKLLLKFINEFLPGFQPVRRGFTVCMYTMTPDGHFILDAHPDLKNIVIAAGFSGHGFKFAPVVGEILSDLAIEGATSHPIDFLRINRFLT